MDFDSWSPLIPATVVDLTDDSERKRLIASYTASPNSLRTFEAVLDHVIELGGTCLLIEHRYIDADWRSEHAALYSGTFRRYPSVCHRFHFFRDQITPDADEDHEPNYREHGYLGYSVIRPLPTAPVGRTMLIPTPEQRAALKCEVQSVVYLFGQELTVSGAPLMSQDGQVGVCGHASAWIVGYYHHLSHGGLRVLTAEIATVSAVAVGPRLQPVNRVTTYELRLALHGMGLRSEIYELAQMPEHLNVHELIEYYVASGLPVVIAYKGHTRVIVGFDGSTSSRRYLVQDDVDGPYQWIDLPQAGADFPVQIIVPLPDKVFISGEHAERVALLRLPATMNIDVAERNAEKFATQRADLSMKFTNGTGQFRMMLMRSNEYKRRSLDRYPLRLAIALRYHWMPRYIWIAQLVDTSDNIVLAEALMDATDHLGDLRLLASWTPGLALLWQPDAEVMEPVDLSEDLRLPVLERDFGSSSIPLALTSV